MIETEHFCKQCLAEYLKENWKNLEEAKSFFDQSHGDVGFAILTSIESIQCEIRFIEKIAALYQRKAA